VTKNKLRSSIWFNRNDEMGVRHRSALSSLGHNINQKNKKPIIGICNPYSEFNNCEMAFQNLVPVIKRGIVAAGGIPIEFSTMSLGAELLKPADMLYRNLVSMEIEETIRGYPIDGIILLCNCDKTTPAQLMACASANIPAIQFSGGHKSLGFFQGEKLSSGTDFWKYWDEYRKGQLSQEEWNDLQNSLSCSLGACNEMGTTSTMTALSEVLGMMPLGSSTLPANDSRRMIVAENLGHYILSMIKKNIRPRDILSKNSFFNAICALAALGGSTNAIIHLTAIAGRCGIKLDLKKFDEIFSFTPLIVNVKPSGNYIIEDFHNAGGIPNLLFQLKKTLYNDCINHTGEKFNSLIKNKKFFSNDVIRDTKNPVKKGGSLIALFGNLVPKGAILKVSAASNHLLKHVGNAFVFNDYEDMLNKIDNTNLDVNKNDILVMKNCGPRGVPGMPEWGQIPIPKKLLERNITDIIRISDARMSGTSFGTVILHSSPESALGGPLSIVKNGDKIELDATKKQLNLLLSEDEIKDRLSKIKKDKIKHLRGYPRLYVDHVLQADEGCDFDFLLPDSPNKVNFIEPTVGKS
tara:strand:+ start:1166 stop:2899 length:1734 start_codon:yes stop_codon:yes gene_type:complete